MVDDEPGLDPTDEPESRQVPSPVFAVRVGDRVGKLVAIEPVGKGPYGTLWRMYCDCGDKDTIRPAARINLARNAGTYSMCRKCLKAYRKHGRSWKVKRILWKTWEHFGALYSPVMIERMTAEIREESELPEPTDLGSGPFVVSDVLEAMGSPDRAMTLEEIGVELGVCRERVRQIEAIALEKCRKWFENQDREEITMQAEIARRHWLEDNPTPKAVVVRELPPAPEREKVAEEPVSEPLLPTGMFSTADAVRELRLTYTKLRYRLDKLKLQPAAYYERGESVCPLWSRAQLEQIRAWRRAPSPFLRPRTVVAPLLTWDEVEAILAPTLPDAEDVFLGDHEPKSLPVYTRPTASGNVNTAIHGGAMYITKGPIVPKRATWVIRSTSLIDQTSLILEEKGKRVEFDDMDEAMTFAKNHREPGYLFVAEFTRK